MFELWAAVTGELSLVGQYSTRDQAIRIGLDYLARGVRCQVRRDDTVVWESGHKTPVATRAEIRRWARDAQHRAPVKTRE